MGLFAPISMLSLICVRLADFFSICLVSVMNRVVLVSVIHVFVTVPLALEGILATPFVVAGVSSPVAVLSPVALAGAYGRYRLSLPAVQNRRSFRLPAP